MRIEVNPNGFNELNTAILYSRDTAEKIMWRGSSEGLAMSDLLEYNLEFDIKKKTFATSLTPNLYSLDVRNIIGEKGIIENLDSLIPSALSGIPTESDYWYGSATLNDKTVIILPASSGVYKVELFERFLREGKGEEEPNITIFLGESSEEKVSQKEKVKLEEEITADKAIVIAMSQSTSVSPEVNLAYKAFQLSPNPLRNMEKIYLRNDRFNSLKKDLKIIENIGDEENPLIVDTRSGTLLGTKQEGQNFTPIFAKKLERVNAKTNNRADFSPYRCYEEGDIITFNNSTWRSICGGNIGNIPSLSPGKWVLLNNLSNIFTDQVIVTSDKGGFVTPSGFITIQSNTESHIFDVFEELGYKLSPTAPVHTSSGVEIKNFKITETVQDGKLTKRIAVNSWSDAIGSRKIIFHFIEEGCTIILRLEYNGKFYDIDDWNDFIASMASSDILSQISIHDGSNYLRFKKGDEGEAVINDVPINVPIVFSFPYLDDFQPELLTVTASIGEDNQISTIDPEFDGRYNFPMTTSFSSAEFVLRMIAKKLEIVATGAGFEFDKPRGEVSYSSITPYVLSFYCLDESLSPNNWRVVINGLEIPYGGSLNFGTTRVDYTRGGMEEGVYQLTWIGEFKQSYTVTVSKR